MTLFCRNAWINDRAIRIVIRQALALLHFRAQLKCGRVQ